MKKLMAMAVLVAGVAWATAPFNDTIGTNSVQLVSQKPVSSTAWATNTAYSVGDVVSNGGYYYFATNAGTTTNAAPTHTSGEATYGTMTWRQISPNRRRSLVISVQTSGGEANLSFGTSDAVDEKGVKLVGAGTTYIFGIDDNYQGEVHAISSTSNDVVLGVQEF